MGQLYTVLYGLTSRRQRPPRESGDQLLAEYDGRPNSWRLIEKFPLEQAAGRHRIGNKLLT
jgi:hypothetical protein